MKLSLTLLTAVLLAPVAASAQAKPETTKMPPSICAAPVIMFFT